MAMPNNAKHEIFAKYFFNVSLSLEKIEKSAKMQKKCRKIM